jgi:hypothetical protein
VWWAVLYLQLNLPRESRAIHQVQLHPPKLNRCNGNRTHGQSNRSVQVPQTRLNSQLHDQNKQVHIYEPFWVWGRKHEAGKGAWRKETAIRNEWTGQGAEPRIFDEQKQ